MSKPKGKFVLYSMDGWKWNLGLRGAFVETYLKFDKYEDAKAIAIWWSAWIMGIEMPNMGINGCICGEINPRSGAKSE